jgi:hypothetical protein
MVGWFTPAITTTGGCKDVDISSITQLSFDADGSGDWVQLIATLDSAGLAHIAQRSSRHSIEVPKWHIHFPLWEPWSGTKLEWRLVYRHLVAWFSVAAGLDSSPSAKPPRYGFDHATDRLGQPWFVAARSTEEQAPPETRCRAGLALDGQAFLEATGFDPGLTLRELTVRPRRQPRTRVVSPARLPRLPRKGGGLLKSAFAKAGWLGRDLGGGKSAALCPWDHLHTTGQPFDGSTVIFSPSEKSRRGWFHCAHAHCRDRTQSEVLRAIPSSSLRRAMEELRAASAMSCREGRP